MSFPAISGQQRLLGNPLRPCQAVSAFQSQWKLQRCATVLSAFQNVAHNLRAIAADAATLSAQANAESLARASLEISKRQYRLGSISHLARLVAQRVYQYLYQSCSSPSARLSHTADLFVSLGGTWWNRSEEAAATNKGVLGKN